MNEAGKHRTALQPAPALRRSLGAALEHHAAGRLAEAESTYQGILQADPDQPDALHLSGVIAHQTGENHAAVDLINRALARRPDFAEARNNLGNALLALDQPVEAIASYLKALALRPDYAEAQNNLGNALLAQGKPDEAVISFEMALAVNPDFAEAQSNLARALKDLGRIEDAFAGYLKALRMMPDMPPRLADLVEAINRDYTSGEVAISAPGSAPGDGEGYADFTIPTGELARKDDCTLGTARPRIVLLQPPPWKIAAPGDRPYPAGEGGPSPGQTLSDQDSRMVTHGLLSIAAQLLSSGRRVAVHNISNLTWPEAEKLIPNLGADLFGITCKTFNLRGVGALTRLIRAIHPEACIVVGGPHPTAQPDEILRHFPAIDGVVIGEGETSFMEITEHLEQGEPVRGIAGTAWREDGEIRHGPARAFVADVDSLTSPHEFFPVRTFLTSRGCPFQCTFCASQITWGRNLRFHSRDYVLDSLELAVRRDGMKFLFIKDDTFSASRKRTLSICQGIMERKLDFVWSCDTRVDALDEDVLRAMRLAGCQRISLGVESGAPEILAAIKKKSGPDLTLDVMRMARKFGFQVRFYMIVGNRGESLKSFTESLDLIHQARPTEFRFQNLGFYPGTEEFEIYQQQKNLAPDIFFQTDCQVLSEGFAADVPAETRRVLNALSAALRPAGKYFPDVHSTRLFS